MGSKKATVQLFSTGESPEQASTQKNFRTLQAAPFQVWDFSCCNSKGYMIQEAEVSPGFEVSWIQITYSSC